MFARSLEHDAPPLQMRYADGRLRTLPVHLWTAQDIPGDAGLLDRCLGATLDVGCGPGRLSLALWRRGQRVLGVDSTAAAIEMATARGAPVLMSSIFDKVPEAGEWDTALLADGNLGIGGDPLRLLRRLVALLNPVGVVVAELDAASSRVEMPLVRLEHDELTSHWFRWAHVTSHGLALIAERAGMRVTEAWSDAGRSFATLAADADT